MAKNHDEIIEIAGEKITLGELEKHIIKVREDYKILQRYSVPVTFTKSVDVVDGVLQHIHDLRSKVAELENEIQSLSHVQPIAGGEHTHELYICSVCSSSLDVKNGWMVDSKTGKRFCSHRCVSVGG